MKTINPQIQKLHEPRRNLKKTTPRNITVNLLWTSDERGVEQSRIEGNRVEYTNIPQTLVIIEMNENNKYKECQIKAMKQNCYCCSAAQLCLTLRPHELQHTRLPLSFTISRTLLKLMSLELVMPSNHLILCFPLLLLPPIFPSNNPKENDSDSDWEASMQMVRSGQGLDPFCK